MFHYNLLLLQCKAIKAENVSDSLDCCRSNIVLKRLGVVIKILLVYSHHCKVCLDNV